FGPLNTSLVIVNPRFYLLALVSAFEFVVLFFDETIITYSFTVRFLYRKDQHALAVDSEKDNS
ncbi:MAG: hypothetical protein ACK4ML_16430, partial [Alishewanella aestuarii]